MIGGAKVNSSFQVDFDNSSYNKTEKKTTRNISIKNPVTIPPHSKVNCTFSVMEGRLKCTGTMTSRVHYKNGNPVEITSKVRVACDVFLRVTPLSHTDFSFIISIVLV